MSLRLHLICTCRILIIEMIKSDNMERPMSLKEEFITYISQENGAHRAMQGHMGKAAGLVRKQEQE